MATEFWRGNAPGDVAIRITPSDGGDLRVLLDGDTIYDRAGGEYPNLTQVLELNMAIADRIVQLESAPSG